MNFNEQAKLGKEKFYLFSQRFFEKEIIKEIYQGDYFSICNILDVGYLCFDFIAIQHNNIEPFGVIFNKETMERIIKDPGFYYNDILKNVSNNYFKENTVVLDENNFKILLQRKKDFYGEPPNENVSHEWEQKIMDRNKKMGGI